MTSWDTTAFGRRLAALAITIGLALGVGACSDGSPEQGRASASAPEAGSGSAMREQLQTGAPLAELQGQGGLSLTITSAERDPAGYLTVRGNLKNDGATVAVVPAELRGDELQVLRTGPSLGGATLVDFAHKKRYYVLRDTDGRPLTTTGLSTLKGGESASVFMQFPSPASDTVGFQLPLFDTANIKIAG
ncbi:hypothetical protein OG819_54975 [Streptomyces sp. NBC_01549]|uniref:hypothetical protein n=1 Tax=Streptomyces sp. NBC_01549 TaxID=2975874 RepID=UPI002254B2EC|nr:hypothetical protein [Streptomyces sp. NBC_01549]MCX4598263.1 hypothetical protein [Streptomyces sp. NBC_01549]